MIVLADGFPHLAGAASSRFALRPGGARLPRGVGARCAPFGRADLSLDDLRPVRGGRRVDLLALRPAAGSQVARLPAAFGAAGALFFARNPQFFEQWGGAPSLLSAAVGLLLLRDGAFAGKALRRRASGTRGFACSRDAGLIHPLPAVGFVYVFAACRPGPSCHRKRELEALAVNGARRCGGGTACWRAPFLLVGRPAPSSPGLAPWARGWFREETQRALFLERRFLPGAAAAGRPDVALLSRRVSRSLPPSLALVLGLAKRWWKDRGEATAAATAILARAFFSLPARSGPSCRSGPLSIPCAPASGSRYRWRSRSAGFVPEEALSALGGGLSRRPT